MKVKDNWSVGCQETVHFTCSIYFPLEQKYWKRFTVVIGLFWGGKLSLHTIKFSYMERGYHDQRGEVKL